MTSVKSSDKTYTIKAGLLPVAAMTDAGDNDTSVAERRSPRRTRGRLDSYGAVSKPPPDDFPEPGFRLIALGASRTNREPYINTKETKKCNTQKDITARDTWI